MRASLFEKVLTRLPQLGPDELHAYIARLGKEKVFFETIFNTLQEGIVVLDSTGHIEYSNIAAVRLLSLPEKRQMLTHISKYLKGLDWNNLLEEGKVSRRTIKVTYPERRILEFYLLPVDIELHNTQNFAAIFHDVTESYLAGQDAIETERMDAITLLAAGVAHEIGNPLNSLNIHFQLMERDLRKLPADVAQHLQESIDVARGEIDRLDSIINQFLKAIRPSQPNLVPGRVDKILQETLHLLRLELEDRDIFVEEEISSSVPEILLDAEHLKQAFYNIIRNAIQAIGRTGVLKIQIEPINEWLVIRFVDNGSGIAAESMPHVLQPYFTTKKEGTGLGLMIVQKIMRDHGGYLEIESEKNQGTTITLKLPLLNKRVHMLKNS